MLPFEPITMPSAEVTPDPGIGYVPLLMRTSELVYFASQSRGPDPATDETPVTNTLPEPSTATPWATS